MSVKMTNFGKFSEVFQTFKIIWNGFFFKTQFTHFPSYKMTQESLKLTMDFWNNQYFNQNSQGNLMFLNDIW